MTSHDIKRDGESFWDKYPGFSLFLESFSGAGEIFIIFVLFSYGLTTGGPVVMIFSWSISCLFTFVVILNLAEITCAYPRAGPIYITTGYMIKRKWSALVSYYCSIFLLLAYIANGAYFALAFADLLDSCLDLTHHPLLTMDNYTQVLYS